MSSCTECHGMAGDKYDDHTSNYCPRLKVRTTPTQSDDPNEIVYVSFTRHYANKRGLAFQTTSELTDELRPKAQAAQSDDPIRSPKTILSLHIGYEDLMLFHTDGTSESIALSKKCQKEQQEKTDSFADAIRDAPKAQAVQGDDWLEQELLLVLLKAEIKPGDSMIGYNFKLSDDALNKAKAAIQAQLDAAYQRGRIDEAKTCNHARHVLHAILSDDVDSELDHSDIEQQFVAALTNQSKAKETE